MNETEDTLSVTPIGRRAGARWAVLRRGRDRALRRLPSRGAAIEWARTLAAALGLRRIYVHRPDGTVDYVIDL